jgi:hypothetical protein
MRTLIITSTIHVNSNLTVLIDRSERKKQYLKSVLFYLESKFIDQIIICDNSNFDYRQFSNFFEAVSSKEIECLCFEGDKKKIQTYGKGYGEGEIMEYVMNNSKLILKAENSFLKVTGRLKVLNIDDVLKNSNSEKDCFQGAGSNPFKNLEAIDTRFYQCTFSTFKDYLISEYKNVNDDGGLFLEHCYYNKFLKAGIAVKSFNILPIISGLSGSTGLNYDDKRSKLIVKRILFYIAKKIYR